MHQLVEREPRLRPLAVAEPADARRQALEWHALLGEGDPAGEGRVAGEELEDGAVGAQDVRRVPGQRDPSERPAPLLELRPDERGHEARVIEGVRDTRLTGLGAEVVAVV